MQVEFDFVLGALLKGFGNVAWGKDGRERAPFVVHFQRFMELAGGLGLDDQTAPLKLQIDRAFFLFHRGAGPF